ncbi:MAG: hypothetical protein RQ760_10640 [Sedimentisphaerales bacterium]|nr:hypothetical protein [Sedimentisphaerales bacterium]
MDRSVEQLVDEILVMDCQSGRVKAMEILVSRWQKRLWQYRLLKLFLRIIGSAVLFAIVAVVMHYSWINIIHK